MEEERTPIATDRLANGMTICFHDLSRPVAGDRWQVVLRCDASIPITDALWQAAELGDPGPEIRATLGSELTLSLRKERNFISQTDKEDLLAEMVGQIRRNMLGYLHTPRFPARLLARRCHEIREELGFRAADRTRFDEPEDEEAGPADFSYLFAKPATAENKKT
ncbi:MAG: hypothetical protein A2521_16465 [Deltaproteobacteria bacterium RIFOXYD12_FULL_57_12]|nr:MAG: hypothetical protein A2521_16465 [Deltaproteobacteria bacterium RIFOXYD12_FULL_57_12]